MRGRLILIFILLCQGISARTVTIHFRPLFGVFNLITNQVYTTDEIPGVSISMLKFYISQVSLEDKGNIVWADKNAHLLDADDPESMTLQFQVPENCSSYDALQFSLGIDSITNTAGAQGGDLDATKGMYWAWQSGYINFKMEGSSPQCRTRKNEFSFHLGGFRGSDYCLQQVMIRSDNEVDIYVGVDLSVFFRTIDLATVNEIMIPGPQAVKLSALAAAMFIPISPR